MKLDGWLNDTLYGNYSDHLQHLDSRSLSQGSRNLTEQPTLFNNTAAFTSDNTSDPWASSLGDGLGSDTQASTEITSGEGTSHFQSLLDKMILPINTTSLPDSFEDATTAEPPSDDLKPIHIHFLIVGVLFILVLIMLGLHNYIELVTDGGKKSIPAFGGGAGGSGDGTKGKPRATLRPVISTKPKGGSGNKGSSKL